MELNEFHVLLNYIIIFFSTTSYLNIQRRQRRTANKKTWLLYYHVSDCTTDSFRRQRKRTKKKYHLCKYRYMYRDANKWSRQIVVAMQEFIVFFLFFFFIVAKETLFSTFILYKFSPCQCHIVKCFFFDLSTTNSFYRLEMRLPILIYLRPSEYLGAIVFSKGLEHSLYCWPIMTDHTL